MTAERPIVQSARRRPQQYQAVGFFMLRAPLLPAALYQRLTASQPAPTTQLDLLDEPLAGTALAAASAELYHRLQTTDGRAGLSDPASRLSRSLFRYLNRMITRPTPFGLFAAVGTGLFEGSTSLRLGRDVLERVVFSPDTGWLESLLQVAIDDPAWHRRVWLAANDSVFEAGGRLVHTRAAENASFSGGTVSVRASTLVRTILVLARQPVRADALAEQLNARYHHVDQERVQRLIKDLCRLDFLRAEPGLTQSERDPCAVAAPRITGLGAAGARLADIERELRELERLEPAQLTPVRLLDLDRRQRVLTPGYAASTLQVDAALALRGRGLNRGIGDTVADAATVLASMAATSGTPHLHDYALAFLERYGPGEEVPVLELLDPHTGLDAPRGYLWPAPAFPPVETVRADRQWREQLLLGWVQQAMLDGGSVELTEQRIGQLTEGTVPRPPPPLLDVYVQVHAASPEAIDRGDWLAAIAPMGIVPGGRSFGRFHRLLPLDVKERLSAFLRSEEELDPGAVFAELSYRPAETRMRNVNGHAHLRRYEIPVDVVPSVPDEYVLGLDDLLIGIHDGRFSIRSRRLQRTVVAVQSHMLSQVRAPNVCRFLLEVSADKYGPLWSFRDPLFSRLPYCPRITRGKVVLSPARWNLTRALLAQTDADDTGFAVALTRWRANFRAPRHVYLVNHDDDQRLLLDLEDWASRADLKRSIDRLDDDPRSSRHYQGLQEVLPDFHGLWLGDENGDSRFCELVVPVALTHPITRSDVSAGMAAVTSAPDRLASPGGIWTQLKLYAAVDRHDQLIAEAARHAEELIGRGHAASWFFVRYADPAPHIRFRVQAAGPQMSAVVRERNVSWAQGLVELSSIREFSVDTYRREVGRYGGSAGLALCERIFHGDSLGVSRVLAGTSASVPSDPLVVAAFTLDRLLAAIGVGDAEKMELAYMRRIPFRSDAAHRQRRVRLLDLMRAVRGSAPQPECTALDGLYGAGARLSTEPAAVLASLPLSRLWPSIVDSIAHMHVNRMLGVNRQAEIETGVLLRSCLLALRHAPALASAPGRGENSPG